jgi:hypothetical protein
VGAVPEQDDTMPKNSSAARREQARALAATENISYTAALRRLDAARSAESTAGDEPGAVVRKSKAKIRARMAQTGEPYSEAARQIDSTAGPARLTPPPGWRSVLPEMLSTWRDGDQRVVEVLDAASGQRLASVTMPWRDPDELAAEYEAAGVMDGVPGSMAWEEMTVKVRLGRPDLIVNQLGWEGGLAWQEWPDGSWRSPAFRLGRRHLVTATPLSPVHATIGTITVRAYPGGTVVTDEIIQPVRPDDTEALDRALDRLGYTVDHWTALPGHVRYGAALPGHLAERDWYTLARVRIVKETTVGAVDPRVDRTFRPGEIVTMHQSGRAGREVLRDTWWDSGDIDGAHIIRADCAEVVEVLEDHPPMWDAAALTAEQVTGLLAPHHPGAAEAVRAWAAAGLHVSYCHGGLAIRTPAPERRKVGHIPRDYWNGNKFTKPYEAVSGEDKSWRNRALDRLPLDPVAAAIRIIDAIELGEMLVDDDLIRNGLWWRESHGAAAELGDEENWDYDAVEDAWIASSCAILANHCITWDPDTDKVTIPADMTTEEASRIWQAARGRFGTWIDDIVAYTRKGRHLAPPGDLRPATAPGAHWVTRPRR